MKIAPNRIWILIDTGNSNPNARNYCWFFETRSLARDYKRYIKSLQARIDGNYAKLVGPFQYRKKFW